MGRKNTLAEAPYKEVITYVDEAGNHGNTPRYLHHELVSYVNPGSTVEWRPNVPFVAELELVRSARGRSSVTFIYRDVVSGIHYPLFVSAVEDVLRNCAIANGRVTGSWWVVKRGTNYGLELQEAAVSG